MNSVQHLTTWLSGRKTYLIAVAATLYAWGVSHGLWQHSYVFDTLLGSGGLAALRSGIKTEAIKIAQALLSDPPQLPKPPTTTTPTTPTK